ncbi:MAG: spermidine synthase [Gammaproteobacteria bacterium]|nr:spermidine synthase [Gammaproteobacteria bacterium]
MLAIFMGGMAIGAWVPSRFGARWKNLLVSYALVEAIIGFSAVVFHNLFINVTDTAYDTLIPALASPWAVNFFKWGLAAFLILPQSILLGMTFPLMSASLIRRHPGEPGKSLAMLYFTNSFGAAIGVLIGGFVLIGLIGLPGTILTAGLLNIGVALVAWLIARRTAEPPSRKTAGTSSRRNQGVSWYLLIAVAFLTGAASFIYEIGWIRMLNLVLGTSTHAFELMLSAFIIGLAFGGLWIRNRIDRLAHPARFLGWVQVIMGLLALATLFLYNISFDVMRQIMHSVTPTDGGYLLFNLGSHIIAVLIMVPVTFCAGMTLPLITHMLLRSGHGEKSIGAVYAANTAGAIAGVFFAVHIGLSALGLKGLITAGAALDMTLGIVLLGMAVKRGSQRPAIAAALISAAMLLVVLGGVEFDRYKMVSGVYRHGVLFSRNSTEILYHKDGKTATVDLHKSPDGGITISTNGKADARISMGEKSPVTADEATMILVGAIPLILHPQARTAANIGMGSGLTTHVLLSGAALERVDTIEIEPAMIEAARGFRPLVEAAFSDPRSHFHIDDAKSFFSANQSRYDIIVSEPSNPWVSGVASLFTDEFYHRARVHLNSGGIFVQWLHVYEMNFELVASVMKAIGRNFSDYTLYATNDGDLMIVAVREGRVPALDEGNWKRVNLASLLGRIDIHTYQDLESRRIGDRALLDPMFAYTPVPVNSDFFPILDLNAVRARFMKNNVTSLTLLRTESLPALELLSEEPKPGAMTRLSPSDHIQHPRRARAAEAVRDYFTGQRLHSDENLAADMLRHVMVTLRLADKCQGVSMPELWLDSVYEVMMTITPYLKPSETDAIWRRFRSSDCHRRLPALQQDMFALWGAVGRRDAPKMAFFAEKILNSGEVKRKPEIRYLLATGMLGNLADNKPEKAYHLWTANVLRALGNKPPDVLLRLLWSHTVHESQRARNDQNIVSAK